jgi:hypothetical protein
LIKVDEEVIFFIYFTAKYLLHLGDTKSIRLSHRGPHAYGDVQQNESVCLLHQPKRGEVKPTLNAMKWAQ